MVSSKNVSQCLYTSKGEVFQWISKNTFLPAIASYLEVNYVVWGRRRNIQGRCRTMPMLPRSNIHCFHPCKNNQISFIPSSMAVIRAPALRHIIGESAPYLRGSQRRWAQVHDVRFLATHRESDRVIEKYKEKLDKKAKEYASSGDHRQEFLLSTHKSDRSTEPVSKISTS